MIILSKYEPNIFSYANVTPQCKLLITISLWICPHTNTARNHELAYRSLRCPNRTSTHKQRIKDITPHQSISPERTFQTPIQSVLCPRLLWFCSKEAALLLYDKLRDWLSHWVTCKGGFQQGFSFKQSEVTELELYEHGRLLSDRREPHILLLKPFQIFLNQIRN